MNTAAPHALKKRLLTLALSLAFLLTCLPAALAVDLNVDAGFYFKQSRGGRGGAREIRRLVRHEMEAPLAALLLGARAPERVRVDLRDDRPVFPVS